MPTRSTSPRERSEQVSSPAGRPDSPFAPLDTFARRHLGAGASEIEAMLATIGVASLDALIDETVPASIRLGRALAFEAPAGGRPPGEREITALLAGLAERNRRSRSFLGMGYYGTLLPAVIQRNVLENPGWYTQYTPYQA
ncbi:MAG: glycine dehydrogenase (aminomethyl-transferring), partial [Thermoanaerobaculia bacterium]|nr:glycine dehydrogenase (aminomethyl-transferring) [Thermoanaerobaculia bacterium]